jgi:hypothetical protein
MTGFALEPPGEEEASVASFVSGPGRVGRDPIGGGLVVAVPLGASGPPAPPCAAPAPRFPPKSTTWCHCRRRCGPDSFAYVP